jgi:Family of unknown function (DUF6326)
MAQDRIELANTADAHEEKKMDMESKLSTLWIFVSLNYLYCDVSSLMDPELLPQYLRGNVHGLQFSPMFLLSAGILVEIFIAMVLLSRVLPYSANRWANIAAGIVMTTIQLATLFFGVPAPYYAFFSAIEISTTAFIVWYAWNWTEAALAPVHDSARARQIATIEALLLHSPRPRLQWIDRAVIAALARRCRGGSSSQFAVLHRHRGAGPPSETLLPFGVKRIVGGGRRGAGERYAALESRHQVRQPAVLLGLLARRSEKIAVYCSIDIATALLYRFQVESTPAGESISYAQDDRAAHVMP